MSPVIFPEFQPVDAQVQSKCTWVWLCSRKAIRWSPAYLLIFDHDEEGDRGLDRSLLSSHAAICASSYQENWFEEKNSAVFAHQNSPEHHWPVTLRKEPFLHIAVLWNSAHKTRRLLQVLHSLKDNSVRVFWCLLAWSYCSVTASKQGALSLCNCCEVLHCSAFRSATRH